MNRLELEIFTAHLLAKWPTHLADRAEVRAKLPPGTIRFGSAQRHAKRMAQTGSPGSINRTSKDFQNALAHFEKWGWVRRTPTTIEILDRTALAEHEGGFSP